MRSTGVLIERLLQLPAAETRQVRVQRDLAVPMRDGVVLRADRYVPAGGDRPPLLLLRSPYGRGMPWRLLFGRIFAERGYQVVLQSCRGTQDSEGHFEPFVERDDGLDTLSWLRQQPWYPGRLAMLGPSYFGLVQWAVADAAPGELVALGPSVVTSRPGAAMFPGGAVALEWPLRASAQVAALFERGLRVAAVLWVAVVAPRRLARALRHRPLGAADRVAAGRPLPWWREWLAHPDPDDDFWQPRDHSRWIPRTHAAVIMSACWDDTFLPWQLADWEALADTGGPHRLVISPGGHDDNRRPRLALQEGLAWFDHHLRDQPDRLEGGPVRYYVTGAEQWRDAPSWPPPEVTPHRWHLQAGGDLSPFAPNESTPSRYRFDPADPTPAAGGPLLTGRPRVRQDRVERRSDVLMFTSQTLQAPLDLAGPVRATVHLRSSVGHADVVVRLCDVDADGRSINVCDGIRRVDPDAVPSDDHGVRRVAVDLWPTAHRFAAGHRVRVHVASGAFPRFAPNPGTGEPQATAIRAVAADQEVFHDPSHPSHVVLPVVHRQRGGGAR